MLKHWGLTFKVAFLAVVCVGALVAGYHHNDLFPRKEDHSKDVQLINVTEAELHKMHTDNQKKLLEIVMKQGARISDLEDRVRCLENPHQMSGFNKPIVPGTPPPGVPGPVEVLPFPKEARK